MNGTSTEPVDTRSRSKITAYLDLVEARVLRPLASEEVQESCSTTLLLVFATIDALGKLIHPDDIARPGKRFKYFLGLLGVEYKKRSKELWKLRNALVHNAINVEAYLSSTEEPEQEGWAHLEMLIGGSGLIYINTRRAASDVLLAFRRVKEQIEKDEAIAQRASDRLAWADNTQQGVEKKEFTPPAPVQFVTLKDNCPVRRPRCC